MMITIYHTLMTAENGFGVLRRAAFWSVSESAANFRISAKISEWIDMGMEPDDVSSTTTEISVSATADGLTKFLNAYEAGEK